MKLLSPISKMLTCSLLIAGALFGGSVLAAGGGALPYGYEADVGNLPSVQRGAKYFMAYCSGCHSMQYMRYSRVAQDLQIPEEMLQANLMFTSDKIGDTIVSAMPKEKGKEWFGQLPPDLTLETRARGEDWVYSYLKSFYVDPARPLGVNNLVLAGASMPHVLWELQGWQVPATHEHDEGGEDSHGGHDDPFEIVQAGSLEPRDYDKFVGDLVNFMAYAAEPGRSARQALGVKVLVYLFVLLGFAFLLKKEYWRDVH
ncbi:cytochrome c1 [Panacagrimonas sp.]|uniref:cytochrome c1 n=1 Tax=Panacagrimonas sp. TaxID=2480088 RepID=UPI003B51E58A